MATIRLVLKGAPENISLRSFSAALTNSLDILEDLDLAISHEPKGSLEWVVTRLSVGSLSVTIESRSKIKARNFGPDTAEAFVTGLDRVEKQGVSPPYLSEHGLKKARNLAGLVGQDGVAGIQVTDLGKTAEISRVAFENIRQITQIRDSAIGSVEGTIETLSIHGRPRFLIYESRTRKAVSCQFSRDMWFEKIKDIMGKRVIVSGLLHYNMKGEPHRVELEQIRLMKDRTELPGIKELGGSDPEFTGGLSTEEYIKLIRNG
jgi:hypothetical protein